MACARSGASCCAKATPLRAMAVSFEAVEFATLEWVDWFNNRWLLEPIGISSPWRPDLNTTTPGEPGAVQILNEGEFGQDRLSERHIQPCAGAGRK